METLDRQISLHQQIKTADLQINHYSKWCRYYQTEMPLPSRYDKFREELSFHIGRRSWLLQRLLKMQLKEFNYD